MKLYSITLLRLKNLESAAFISRFIEDFENSDLDTNDDTVLKLQFEALKLESITFNKAANQIKASALTTDLKLLDKRRDRKFAVVKRFTSAYEYSDEEEELAAYHEIWLIIKQFKVIKNANYMAETLAIELFIKRVRNAKDNSMNKLGLKSAIDNLETANESFKTVFGERSSIEISKEKLNTTLLRDAIFENYKSLANYILIMAKVTKTPYYITALKVLNIGREYFNWILKRRNGGDKE